MVLHNDAAEMHGNQSMVSVVGQARVVHDLVLHDAAVIHEDSMIHLGFSLANTFFHFSVAFGVVVAVCSWVEISIQYF